MNRVPRCKRVRHGKNGQIHDMVVRRVRGNRHTDATTNRRADAAGPQRPAETQCKQRDDPRRQQIEMAQQMRRYVWGSTKGYSGKQRRPAIAHDVERQRIRARGVQKHRHHDVKVLGLNHRQPAQRGCRNVALQRGVWMIDEVDAKRAEQESRLKEIELWRAQRLAHPPEVPQKAVVISPDPWDVIAEMKRERPGPDERHGRQQREGSEVRSGSAGCTRRQARIVQSHWTGLTTFAKATVVRRSFTRRRKPVPPGARYAANLSKRLRMSFSPSQNALTPS